MTGVQNLVRLLRTARPYRLKIIAAVASAVGVAITSVTIPLVTRAAIDNAVLAGDLPMLWRIVGFLIGVGVVRAILFNRRRILAGKASISTEADLRQSLYDHVQGLDLGYHEQVSTGEVMSRASNDLQAVRGFIVTIPWSFTLLMQIVGVTAVMLTLHVQLTLLAVAALPPLTVAAYRFSVKFDPVIWRLQQKLADLAGVVEETVVGIRVVKGFGREPQQLESIKDEAEGVYRAAADSIRLRASFIPLSMVLPQIGVVVVVWYGGYLVLTGGLTLGTLVAFQAFLLLLAWPLRSIGQVVAGAQRAATAAGRIFEVLDTPPGIADRPGARPLQLNRGEVRFEDVRYAYHPDSPEVLRGIDLHVPAGTSLAIVGPTGSGKSTLIRLLGRFSEPTAGRVTVDDQDVAEVTLHSLRTQIGTVFEETLLFSATIRENIAFGRPDASEAEIVRAAMLAQAHEFIEEMSEGYDTMVGEQGYTLSGGQRQRVSIARAILMNPPILVLDGATSNVDAKVESAILEDLEREKAGRTTIIVARRPSSAAVADRVAYLENGKVAALGTHHELWRDVPAYREALGARVERTGLEEAAR